jgi:hypothetical protein
MDAYMSARSISAVNNLGGISGVDTIGATCADVMGILTTSASSRLTAPGSVARWDTRAWKTRAAS